MGALPNAGDYVEFSIEDTPWTDNIFTPKFEVINGKVAIPSELGWGVTINSEWLDGAVKRVSTIETDK